MADEEKNTNIVRFKPRSPEDEAKPPVVRKPRDREGCQHKYGVVDEVLWRLECDDCGEVLDPIWFLLTVVSEYEMRDWKFKAIEEFQQKERERAEKRRQRSRA
jgi:hypothetical protein